MKKISSYLLSFFLFFLFLTLFLVIREKYFVVYPDSEVETIIRSTNKDQGTLIFPEKRKKPFLHYLPPSSITNVIHRYKNGEIIYNLDYTIDSGGFRNPSDIIQNPYKKHLFLVGCSLIFGIGLDEQDTLRSILQEKTNSYTVYNLGLPGTGPHDHLWLLQEFNYRKYAPQEEGIFIFFAFDDHIKRSTGAPSYLEWAPASSPYFTFNNQGVPGYAGEIGETSNWKNIQMIKSKGLRQAGLEVMSQLDKINDTDLKNFASLIFHLKNEYLKQYPKGRFLYLTFPHTYPYTDQMKRIEDLLKQSGVELIPYSMMNAAFTPYVKHPQDRPFEIHPQEQHPNQLANKILATELAKFLNLELN